MINRFLRTSTWSVVKVAVEPGQAREPLAPSVPKKINLGLKVTYSSTINLDRIWIEILLEYIISSTRLVLYGTEGVSTTSVGFCDVREIALCRLGV